MGAAPLGELCCEVDHGITIPASTLLSVGGQHVLYYEARLAPHEARYDPYAPMALGVAVWKRHRLAGVRHATADGGPQAAADRQPQTGSRQCSQLLTKSFDLSDLDLDGRASEMASETSERQRAHQPTTWYVTVNVGFGADDHAGAPANTTEAARGATSLLCAEVLRSGCSGSEYEPLLPLMRSVPIVADASAAVLRWRGVGARPSTVVSTLATSRRVRLRFVLCGAAKLYSFTLWKGTAPESADDSTVSRSRRRRERAAAGSRAAGDDAAAEGFEEGSLAASAYATALNTSLYDRMGRSVREHADRWSRRLVEMSQHALAYGRCHHLGGRRVDFMSTLVHNIERGVLPTDFGRCPGADHRFTAGCAYPVAWAMGTQPALIEGVGDCKRHCLQAYSGQARFASFSWSRYECICYMQCDLSWLAMHQQIDDTQPQLLDRRPIITHVDGDPNPFDFVSFPVDEPPLPARSPFPRQLWNTTAGWAADWVEYVATHGGPSFQIPTGYVPRWRVKKKRLSQDTLHENSTSVVLSADGRRTLGAESGFCGHTAFGPACQGSNGALPLDSLQPRRRDWRAAFEACEAACRACDNCNYVTVSLKDKDCSWYRDCDLEHLNTQFAGFYTKRVQRPTTVGHG